jgi:ribosomal protein S14
MGRKTVPVQLYAWIDCPQCGRIDELSRDFRLPTDIAGPMQLKVRYRCERCGRAAAFLYLDRTVISIH